MFITFNNKQLVGIMYNTFEHFVSTTKIITNIR